MKLNKLFISIIVFLALIQLATAIPNSISIQGKLTNSAGTIQTGTFNFTFRIYDGFTGGNKLWESVNQTATTDSRGVYDVLLKDINLSFAEQLYLGIGVNNDNEMEPRINLTSVPYTFRANISDDLNKNGSYTAANLNATGNITLGNRLTFGLGQFIDNLVSGLLKVTGSLNITGGLNVSGTIQGFTLTDGNVTISSGVVSASQVNVGGGFSSGGLTLDSSGNIITQGDVLFSGNVTFVNVTFLSVNGSLIPALDNQFDIGNGSFRWRNANLTGTIQANSFVGDASKLSNLPQTFDLKNVSNYTEYMRYSTFSLANISNYTEYMRHSTFSLANISNYTTDSAFNASVALWNITSLLKYIFLRDSTWTVRLGNIINPTFMNDTLIVDGNVSVYGRLNGTNITATRFTGKLDCGMIDGGSDGDYCADATGTVDTSVYNRINFTYDLNNSNASIALWNFSSAFKYIFTRDSAWTVRLGNTNNTNATNDTLVVFGNTTVYGNLNATTLGGTLLELYNRSIDLGNYQKQADAYNYANNQSGREAAYFRLLNVSNYTTDAAFNASVALWNRTGTNTVLRNNNDNVGIGTTSPAVKLVVIGNANISDSLNVSGTVQAATFIGDGSKLTGIGASVQAFVS